MAKGPATQQERLQILATVAYQFGTEARNALEPLELIVNRSKATGKIRFVSIQEGDILSMNPSIGMFTPTKLGATIIHKASPYPKNRVVAHADAVPFVGNGKTLFAKHVLDIDPNIAPRSAVLVVDEEDNLLASGQLAIPTKMAVELDSGIAVKVRRGFRKNK